MAIDLLDDKDFEHKDGVIGLASDFRGVEFTEDRFERFPVDEFINAREDVFREILIDEMFAYSDRRIVFFKHKSNSYSFSLAIS